MIIQIILIVLLLAIGAHFIRSRNTTRTKALKKLLLLLTIPAAVIAVLFPGITTDIAHAVGVGRGADLLLYGVTVTVIFQLFDSYVKSQQEQRHIVTLVRKVALLEAELEKKNGRQTTL